MKGVLTSFIYPNNFLAEATDTKGVTILCYFCPRLNSTKRSAAIFNVIRSIATQDISFTMERETFEKNAELAAIVKEVGKRHNAPFAN